MTPFTCIAINRRSSRCIFADAPKSQCSSLDGGESSFECYGESEATDNKNGVGEEEALERGCVQVTNMSRLSQSMMGGNGINQQQLSPLTSDSSGGDPELSINSSNGNAG